MKALVLITLGIALAGPVAAENWQQLTPEEGSQGEAYFDADSIQYDSGRDALVVARRYFTYGASTPSEDREFILCRDLILTTWVIPVDDDHDWDGPHISDERDGQFVGRYCALGRSGMAPPYQGPEPPVSDEE